ncbi:MAG: zinc ribbon domain-containing protein [Ruminococcus sp.]|nr:zinc ribbon domain-containing protein [Ruminococcus sp.]
MNCTVCGAELERGKDFCPNCGTKLTEMPGHGKGGSTFGKNNQQMQASQYQNELNFTKDFNNVSVKKSGGSGSKVGGIIALVLVLLLAGVFAAYWFWIRPMQTKVFEFDKFSIEMPKTMEQATDEDNIFGSLNSSSAFGFDIDADAYENNDVKFLYLVMDFSNVQQIQDGSVTLDSLSPETMMLGVESEMKTRQDYEVLGSGSDYIKCKYQDNEGDDAYIYMTVKKKDKAFYIFGMGCTASDMSKYQAKIDKWMKTISIK